MSFGLNDIEWLGLSKNATLKDGHQCSSQDSVSEKPVDRGQRINVCFNILALEQSAWYIIIWEA